MNADRTSLSSTRSPKALERPHDDEEFLAACVAIIMEPDGSRVNGSPGPPDDARGEASPGTMPSATAHVEHAATRPNPVETADLHQVIRRLQAHVEELREALTESQSQSKGSSEISRENEMLRQELAHAHRLRSADAKALEDWMDPESYAQAEVVILSQTLTAMTADRAVDMADLKEARLREAQIRAELQTLREELDHVVTERGREIDELRRHLLEAEEGRATDAAAFLESLNEHRNLSAPAR